MNVKGDDGKERRGEVTKLTSMGPQVKFSDGQHPPMEIVPSADSGRITVAPHAAATLPGQDTARQQRTAQRMQARTGFKGEVLNTGGDGTHTPAGSSLAPASNAQHQPKPAAAKPITSRPAAPKPAAPAAPAAPTPTYKPAYRVPAGTSPANAELIVRAGMMYGTGTPKHLKAVADYGGPKPKKKATPIPQGFSIGGF